MIELHKCYKLRNGHYCITPSKHSGGEMPDGFYEPIGNRCFVFLERIKDKDYPEEDKHAFWYKILIEGKIFYLWVNENAFETYGFKLADE